MARPQRRQAIDAETARLLGAKPPRKKRSDATGQRGDYHKGSRTATVRLPSEVIEWMRQQAEARGLTVNAWLGALVMAEWGRQRE